MINLLKSIFGYCPVHGWFHRCKAFRMDSSYEVELVNWMYGCKICERELKEYWGAKWESL